jgi:hypothetical protein
MKKILLITLAFTFMTAMANNSVKSTETSVTTTISQDELAVDLLSRPQVREPFYTEVAMVGPSCTQICFSIRVDCLAQGGGSVCYNDYVDCIELCGDPMYNGSF